MTKHRAARFTTGIMSIIAAMGCLVFALPAIMIGGMLMSCGGMSGEKVGWEAYFLTWGIPLLCVVAACCLVLVGVAVMAGPSLRKQWGEKGPERVDK